MMQIPQTRILLPVLALGINLLSGCAATSKLEDRDYVAAEKMLPVNVVIEGGDDSYTTVSGYEHNVKVGNQVYRVLQEENAFLDTSTHVGKYPTTILIRYNWVRTNDDAGSFMADLVSAATLLVVPIKVEITHTMSADVYRYSEKLKTFEYSDDAEYLVGLANGWSEENELEIMRKLMNHFLGDLEASGLLKVRQPEKEPAGQAI